MEKASGISANKIFWLSAIVILSATFSSIGVLFATPESLAQYRIAVALLCFALSSTASLLFVAKVQLTWSISAFSMTLAGPAAMWLAALLIFNYVFPEKFLVSIRPMTLHEVSTLARDIESREGWKTYSEWKDSLGLLQELFKKDEETHLEHLLSSGYYHGDQRIKLANPIVQTVFVYLSKDLIVKFQRIRGENPGGSPNIYFTAVPTLPGSKPLSILFARKKSRIVKSYLGEEGRWQEITSDPVDCLVIAVYKGDSPLEGDWLAIDLPKYLGYGSATFELGVLAYQNYHSVSLWELRASPLAIPSAVPLSFKKFPIPAEDNVDHLTSELSSWLRLLDQYVDSPSRLPSSASDFLKNLLDIIKPNVASTKFSSLLKDPIFQRAFSYRIESLNNPLVATFLWE